MYFILITIILLLVENISTYPKIFSLANEDAYLTVPQLATKYGYPIEEHFVTTPDGYILRVHRIPHSKNNNTVSNKPILLQHGYLCSSAVFFIAANQSLAYILADASYDVWLGNARGNQESRNHTTLNPNSDAKFWDFSLHEIGAIDTPTMIDYILNFTKQSQIYYIGDSQGTTTFYIMAATRPDYNAKIRLHLSLTPVVYMQYQKVPFLRPLALRIDEINVALKTLGFNELFPYNKFRVVLFNGLCRAVPTLCTHLTYFFLGYTPVQTNIDYYPATIGHFIVGVSRKQTVHYGQIIKTGYLRQYDYKNNNIKMYGSEVPPSYNLSLVISPGYLFYSTADNLGDIKDIDRICTEMGRGCVKKIQLDGYNHADFLVGRKAPKDLYSKIVGLLGQY